MAIAVETSGLTKRYKNTLAVDNIDLKIPENAFCGFLGKNGAGKTTTLKMLAGLKKPTSGQISIMETEQVFGRSQVLPFGYLPDVPSFYSYMTGEEFLDFCARLCKIPAGTRKDRVKSLLKQVGLENVRTKVSGYSRGMKQRLGIAQALITSPPVIFMDEPISALDPVGRRDVIEIIQSLKGATVIFSTHILADVESICDYVLIIDKGKILAQDYMVNLKRTYATNTAKIKFYQQADSARFMPHVKDMKIFAEQLNPLEVLLRTDSGDSEDLSRVVASVLHGNDLAFEAFYAHNPSLEDIFYEVTGNE